MNMVVFARASMRALPFRIRAFRCGLAIAGLLVATAVPAQEVLPLFADDTPLEFTLAVPVRTLVNQRSRRPEVEGYLEYTGQDGAPVRLDVEVRTRGKSRLEICSFPPLSINLKRGQVKGTLFAGQNRIKLATLCKDSDQYRQYLYLERLLYSIYDTVSDYGFKTRRVLVKYVDTSRNNRESETPGFFIEHIDSLADRTGMRAAEYSSVDREAHDPSALAVYTLFQFLIGNLDWSALAPAEGDECCHNTDILAPPQGDAPLVPVPYDFDMSGFVDASYAEPNPAFRLRSVRQRLYRGFCADNQYLEPAIQKYVAARPKIEDIIKTSELDDDEKEKALEYLNEGFEVLTTPAELQSDIIDKCRGA